MKTSSHLPVASRSHAALGLAVVAGLALLAGAGCGRHSALIPGGTNLRPTVSLGAQVESQGPRELTKPYFYLVHLQWEASDPDGQVAYYLYAVDPPAEGDSVWVRRNEPRLTLTFTATTPDSSATVPPFPPTPVTSRDYHVFVVKAVDDEGASSPPAHVAFTSYTVAPLTSIFDPLPDHRTTALTGPAALIRWTGQDPDGVGSRAPVKYRFKLVPQSTIQQALGLGSSTPTQADLQRYFSDGLPAAFATWDSVAGDTTSKQYEGLTIGQIWYFAVSALDEAGAYEPRFNLDSNLLRFKPDTLFMAPRITIQNSFFVRTQPVGGVDPETVFPVEVTEGRVVPFYWEAEPMPGTVIGGYRWCLDIVDLFDETPRENESQTDRWSSWSLTERSATVGPFFVEADTDFTTEPPTITVRNHRFYVEARDNLGVVSLVTVELHVIRLEFPSIPPWEQRILAFDDFRGNYDRTANGLAPYGTFPTESALDTLLYAVGGFPFHYSPYRLSDPGVFAGFPFDTLDYRFTPTAGLPLSALSQYNAVVWHTGEIDAGLTGSKFSAAPEGALRFINRAGETNNLALYLNAGGSVWLFGNGVAQAIANGYVTRFGGTSPAFFPYTGQLAGGTGPSRDSILWPGNFLYDYLRVRSQMDRVDDGPDYDPTRYLVGMTPYLPDFRTPGAPWPPEGPPPVTERGPADDPRVGPSSARHVGRWAGLPMLTLTTEFPYWPTTIPPYVRRMAYVSRPNEITEGMPPMSVLDTLYLYRAQTFRLSAARDNPDGKPVWLHYWGSEHGQVNWTSAPIWMFERTQLRLVADRVLAQFGFVRDHHLRAWAGPGAARVRASDSAARR